MKFSTALETYMLETGSFNAATSGFAISMFDGTPPTLASDAITGNLVIMFTVGNDGVTGMTWDAVSGGYISRLMSETVTGTCVLSATPTHYRLHLVGESATTADTALRRIQGTCGTNMSYDAVIAGAFVSTVNYPLGNIAFTIPL